MNIRRISPVVAISLLTLSLSGCFSINGTEGAPGLYTMDVKHEFTIGKTTEKQVKDELGKPGSVLSEKDGGTLLTYDSDKYSGIFTLITTAARKEKHKLVRFSFDKSGILRKIRIKRYSRNVIFGQASKEK